MNHIRAAIIIMGGRNTGKRQQHTAKTRSEADAKLRTALGLISQSSGLSTRAQNHVDKAVEQLSLALSSK